MNTEQKFMTIRQTAAAGYDTEFHMRLMQKQGKLPGFFSGRTFKVNVPRKVVLFFVAQRKEPKEKRVLFRRRYGFAGRFGKMKGSREAAPLCGRTVFVGV